MTYSRVFVVEDFNKFDLVLLEKEFGPLVILGTKDYPTHSDGSSWITRYRTMLSKFSENDALFMAGDPVLQGISFLFASEASGGIVNVIKWSSKASGYYVTKVCTDSIVTSDFDRGAR